MCTIKDKQHCRWCQAIFIVCFLLATGLIVAGFLTPPTGVIDGSVLKAVGELLIFPALAFAMRAVELGYDLRLSKGDATMELSND